MPPGVCYYYFLQIKYFFPKNASVNETKNGFGVVFSPSSSMQLISHLLSRCALDLLLADIFLKKKIQICVKSLGYVCPVSTVSVQLIKGQGILNNLPVDFVYLCM